MSPFETKVLYWLREPRIGFIHCNSRCKEIKIKEWEKLDLNKIDYEVNLKNGLYNDGIAIRLGRCLSNGENGKRLFSFALDFDGWDAVFEWFKSWENVVEVAKKTRIEWHEDQSRIHMLFLAERPVTNKKIHIKNGLLEVRCEGQLLFVNPSIHKEGKQYAPLGTTKIAVLDPISLLRLEARIETISSGYMSDDNREAYDQWLDNPNTILGEGEGRHDALKFKIIRYYYKSKDGWLGLTDDERFDRAWKWMEEHCNPIKSKEEFNSLCKWTIEHHKDRRDELHNRLREREKSEDGQRQPTQAELILQISNRLCTKLFHDQYQIPYAAVFSGDHIETVQLSSNRFKNFLCGAYYETHGLVPNSEAISNAISVLKYKADFKGDMITLQSRVAGSKGNSNGNDTLPAGNDTFSISLPKNDQNQPQKRQSNDSNDSNDIFYDLTDNGWNVVRITPKGWSIEKSPIIFRRYKAQIPQVLPSKEYENGIFDKFISLLNVKDDDNKLLLKCYIIALFVPGISKAILMLHGDQGSAKTTLQGLIKMLVDPSSVKTLAFPRDINEFVQKLDHNYIAYFDNVSVIPDWISDILCRAATGSGFSKRMLYSDDDDIIYNFIRCVGFNGINLAATKADLLDRGLIIQLLRINKDKRRLEKYVWADFENIRPQLLGYIFDILVKVLATLHSFELKELARMADFAKVCEAISRAMGYEEGTFIKAYDKNIRLQAEQVLESNIIAPIIVKFMEDKQEWEGSSSELLFEMGIVAEVLKVNIKSRGYPKAPNTLIRRLNEIKATLEEFGIFLNRGLNTKTKVRTVELRKTSLLSLPSLPAENRAHISRDSGNDTSNDIESVKRVSLPMLTDSTPKVVQEKRGGGSNDTLACGNDTENMSVPQNNLSRAQNNADSDSNDSNDILHTITESQPTEVPSSKDQDQDSRKVDDYGRYMAESRANVNAVIDDNNSSNNRMRHDSYRSGGQWYCRNCNDRGDRFYMNTETYCKGGKKK